MLFSRPPAWTYALMLLGGLGIYAFLVLRKTVIAAAWPFCDACRTARRKQLWIGLGTMALGVLVITVLLASSARGDAAWLTIVAGMLIVMGGLHYITMRFNWRRQSAAQVTKDGSAVLVHEPSPQFAAQIPAPADQLPRPEEVPERA